MSRLEWEVVVYYGGQECEGQLALFDLVDTRGEYWIFLNVDMLWSELYLRISFTVVNHLDLYKDI